MPLRMLALFLLASLPALADPLPAQPADEDPYRWLEPFSSPAVDDWVHQQNARTLAVLEGDPGYAQALAESLAVAEADDRIPVPHMLAGKLYNFWQDSAHVRGVWRRTEIGAFSRTAPPWETVLDLDALSDTEHSNWVWKGVDCAEPLQRRCMISLSDGGEDAITVREFDLVQRRFVPGGLSLPSGKQDVAWEDADSLLVAREFSPGELTRAGYAYVVKRVRRGEPLSQAREVFRGSPEDTEVQPLVLNDGDGHRLSLILRGVTFFESEVYLVGPTGTRRVALPAKTDILALVHDQLIVRVKEDWPSLSGPIPAGTLLALQGSEVRRTPSALRPTVILAPDPRGTVESVSATRDTLVVQGLDNVRGRLRVLRPQKDGHWRTELLGLPDNASIRLVDADLHGTRVYASVEGFLQPPTLWQITLPRGASPQLQPVKQRRAQFNAQDLEVEQGSARSTDGTDIPYFLVHRKALALNGKHPTVLYAYGGFEIPMTPSYLSEVGKLWLEKGGVFALANIRGGGEFGPAWHEAGLKTQRQRIYDDFAAVGRALIARGVTSPRHLGIQGGSNGGLLMGVEMTQHPELWNAVDIQVPLLDMLRFEQIAAGASWTGEYGSVEHPDERAFLASISPYAQLRRETRYPEALVWTTTKDDRVGPQHARKFAARLAEYGHPYLFYEVTEGGHADGANLKEKAHTEALEWTYFHRKLDGE